MVPTIKQHLAAMRHTIEKTLIPALDPKADFAREQAGLMLASLDWLMDVQGTQVRYARLEHAEWFALLAALAELAPAAAEGAVRARLDAGAVPPAELSALQAEVVGLKTAAENLFVELGASTDSEGAAAAKRLIGEACRRQSEREQAWVAMTGFVQAGGAGIDAVLEAQESALNR